MFSFALRRALCAAVLLVAPVAARAADATPSPAPSSPPVIARVVTSDRTAEAAGASARTTYVVSRAEILRNGYRNVADALETVPGVDVVRYGPGAAVASLGIRGSSSSQVLVLVDGTPAGGAQIDDVDTAAIPTAGIDRIEVVEGGGSTLYGSGSVGGIVNIITTPLRETTIDARTGSFGENALRIQMPNLSFERAVAEDGYPMPDGTSRVNADYGLTSARVAFDAKADGAIARFTAGITDRHQGTPGATPYYLSPTSRQDDVGRDARLTVAKTSGSALTTLELAATSTDLVYACDTPVDANCPDSYLGAGTPPYAELLTESRVQAGLRTAIERGDARTTIGIDLARGQTRIDDGTPGDPLEFHPFSQSAAFAQENWALRGGSSLYAGVRAERDGGQGGAFSPSLGGIWRVDRAVDVRVNVATAFRAPTAEDLYYPYFSTPTLVPERTRVADVTVDDDAILGGASLAWFVTAGDNLIVFDPVSYTPQNVGRASIAGFTFTLKTVPVRGRYAKMDVTDLYRAQNLETQTRIPGRGPVIAANLELGYLGAGDGILDGAAIQVRTSGDRGPVDRTAPLFDQPVAYARVDAYARFRLGGRSLLTLRGYNLGNERYAEIAGYPMPGRSFALELSTR